MRRSPTDGEAFEVVEQTVTSIGTVTGTEKCVRGHIPEPLNSDVGNSYGNFVKAARLADNDGFWLRGTSS